MVAVSSGVLVEVGVSAGFVVEVAVIFGAALHPKEKRRNQIVVIFTALWFTMLFMR